MTDEKMNKYRQWFESKGYDFEDDELWMESQFIDHSFKDIFQIIEDYVNELQIAEKKITKKSENEERGNN